MDGSGFSGPGGSGGGGFSTGLMTLYSANKAYSSWSLRAWLALSMTGQPFGQVVIPLGQEDSKDIILAHSPSGRLPALRHGEILTWDSLAIFEYLHESFPDAQLWPADREARAHARSICAEMHAGFMNLRRKLPFNIRCEGDDADLDLDTRLEIDRITEIWRTALRTYGEDEFPFLFGEICLADAMFAPVAVRFSSYSVPLDPTCQAYCHALWEWPALQQWKHAALQEEWVDERYEL